MHKRHIILIRHGQQHAVQGERASPDTAGLTTLGMKQADLASQRLEKRNLGELFFSPLQRARETARIIGNRFPDLPRHEVKHLAEISPPYPPEHAIAKPDSAADIRYKLDKIIHRFFHATRGAERYEALVTHGNLIRSLVCRAMHIPRNRWLHLEVLQGSFTEFIVTQNSEIILHSLNDVGHIPRHLRTNSAG